MAKGTKLALAIYVLSALAAIRANAQANTPPQLNPQPDHTIPELTTLVVTNTATDQDVPAQKLDYQLLNRPVGAAIDTNGIITWTPNEAQGPGSYTITTVATDDGTPPMSATNSFAVTVTEVNSAPHFGVIADQVVVETNTVFFSNAATDADIPANTLTYTLLNPPSGASIDAFGEITYTPPPGLAPATYTITTVVTDNGQPPLSATNSFSVTIAAFRTNVTLNVKISLTAYSQLRTFLNTNNPPAVVLTAQATKLATSDFIAAMGLKIGHGTNIFSNNAKLLLELHDVATINQQTLFFVRSGTNDTDVTQYLSLSFPSAGVETSRTNANRGTMSRLEYLITEFKLAPTSQGDFDVQGFTTIPSTTVVNKGQIIGRGEFPAALMANVAGPGHVRNLTAVFKGTITAADRTVEIRRVPGS